MLRGFLHVLIRSDSKFQPCNYPICTGFSTFKNYQFANFPTIKRQISRIIFVFPNFLQILPVLLTSVFFPRIIASKPLGCESMKNKTCNLTSNLYSPRFEHDACGIGAVVDTQGRPSHETVDRRLEDRGKAGAPGRKGRLRRDRRRRGHSGPDLPPLLLRRAGGAGGHGGPGPETTPWACFSCPRTASCGRRRQKLFEIIWPKRQGCPFLLWRPVPVEPEMLRPAGGGLYAQHLAADLGPPGRRRERPGI